MDEKEIVIAVVVGIILIVAIVIFAIGKIDEDDPYK